MLLRRLWFWLPFFPFSSRNEFPPRVRIRKVVVNKFKHRGNPPLAKRCLRKYIDFVGKYRRIKLDEDASASSKILQKKIDITGLPVTIASNLTRRFLLRNSHECEWRNTCAYSIEYATNKIWLPPPSNSTLVRRRDCLNICSQHSGSELLCLGCFCLQETSH